MDSYRKIYLSLIGVVSSTLIGCVSTDKVDVSFTMQKHIKSNIYGLLSSNENNYSFNEFKVNSIPSGGAWVNLRTGLPTWSTDSSICVAGLGGNCENIIDENKFMYGSVDTGNAILSGLVAPLTLGVSLATVKKNVSFDQAEFNKAMKEALSKVDINILNELDFELSDWTKKHEKLVRLNHESISKWKESVSFSVNDTSLLFSNDFVPSQNVHVTSPSFKEPIGIDSSNVDRLKLKVEVEKKRNLNDTTRVAKMADVYCSNENINSFNIKYFCPTTFGVDLQNQKVSGDVILNIISVNKERVLPSNLVISNNEVIIKLSNGKVSLENKTNKFIKIDSVSFYYQDRIATRSGLSLELAPKARLLPNDYLSIESDFNVNWSLLKFQDVTYETAKEKKISFGFAVKYLQSNSNENHTLYEKNEFLLLDII